MESEENLQKWNSIPHQKRILLVEMFKHRELETHELTNYVASRNYPDNMRRYYTNLIDKLISTKPVLYDILLDKESKVPMVYLPSNDLVSCDERQVLTLLACLYKKHAKVISLSF